MNKVLLDTDMFSEITRGIDPVVVRNANAYLAAVGRFTLSVLTVMEVIRGHQRNAGARRIARFLATLGTVELLDLGRDEAELAGRISGDLERVGRPIGVADPMIAAIALTNGLTLATGNTAHFQRVQQAGYPLVLANWRN